MERKQWIMVGVVIALVCVAAGAIILSSNNEDNKLIVETSPDLAPYSYTVDGDYVGLETDIIRAAAESMGYTVEFRQGSKDSILTSVSEGKADIGAAGFTAAPEGTSLRLSDPYLEVRQVLVVPEGSDIQTLDDLNGKKIAVLSGSAGETYTNDIDSLPRRCLLKNRSRAVLCNKCVAIGKALARIDSTTGPIFGLIAPHALTICIQLPSRAIRREKMTVRKIPPVIVVATTPTLGNRAIRIDDDEIAIPRKQQRMCGASAFKPSTFLRDRRERQAKSRTYGKKKTQLHRQTPLRSMRKKSTCSASVSKPRTSPTPRRAHPIAR